LTDATKEFAADDLRRQAASSRRLAAAARTRAGGTAHDALAVHLDNEARQFDPRSFHP
jgi:hypothetical protein